MVALGILVKFSSLCELGLSLNCLSLSRLSLSCLNLSRPSLSRLSLSRSSATRVCDFVLGASSAIMLDFESVHEGACMT